jgi:hypothetical protein
MEIKTVSTKVEIFATMNDEESRAFRNLIGQMTQREMEKFVSQRETELLIGAWSKVNDAVILSGWQ